MKRQSFVCMMLASVATTIIPNGAQAQVSIVRPLVHDLLDALLYSTARRGGQTAAEELEKMGGKQAVKILQDRIVREGGDQALDAVGTLIRRHGVDAMEAMMHAPNVPNLQRALGDLPEDMVGKALRALARGQEGRSLAQTVERIGSQALQLEVQHPGVGGVIARDLGADGVAVASRLTTNQAIVLASHANEIAALPATQKQQFLELLQKRTAEIIAFAEKHPKVLFTSATVSVILAQAERVLGGSEIVFDEAGQPHVITRPGVADRLLVAPFQTLIRLLSEVAAVGLAAWCSIWLYFYFRRQKFEFEKTSGSKHDAQPPGSAAS